MILVILFALLGFWIRGFLGLVVGAFAGYTLSQLLRSGIKKRLESIQSQFVESTFALVGALCKADGVVTRDEIRFAEGMFSRFQLSDEQRELAKAAFGRGKSSDFDLEAEVDRFVHVARGSRTLYQLLLQVQLMAVAADGEIHPAERDMLLRIARRLGLSDNEVARLEALLRAATAGATAGDGPPSKQRLDDAYAALGVRPSASDDELKRAYKKLMVENHPDRVAAQGLPESMREIAEERAREINAAYDLIKKARQHSS